MRPIVLLVLMNIHLTKCTMCVSVGVNGAVNGRSASAPSENSAGNTSSLPTKGNSGKTKANNSRIEKSSQELGQLQQKITLKTKDKVNAVFAQALEYNTLHENALTVLLFTIPLFLAPFLSFNLIKKCGLLL